MNSQVVWTELAQLKIPSGFTCLSPVSAPLAGQNLEEVTFFVPPFEGGRDALSAILRMPKLKVVQLSTAGYEEVLEFMRPGLTLCNAKGVHDESTAELALGLTIAALRNFPNIFHNQMHGQWNREQGRSLTGSRIGIIGFGSVGRMIKKILNGFTVETVAFSRSGSDESKRIDELDRELPHLDIVILAVPLNSGSRKLFDAGRLALMKDGALLVNVARGQIIDTDALIVELNSGRIQAALDVTDPEPLPGGHPLWSAEGVLISPHMGGSTTAFEPRFKVLVDEQLHRLKVGKPLKNVIVEGVKG